MRKVFLAALTVAALAFSGGAFAQSHQGGYLGLNPGASNQVAAAPAPSDVGSHQGGYLGENAGSKLAPARAAGADMKASPMAWCANAMDPGRCRSRAEPDHAYCMQHNPDNYANCRRTMDFIGWHN